MSCPHSSIGRADRCSQCLGVVARRVDQAGPALTIDGQPAGRPMEIQTTAAYYGKRGKAQSMRVTRRR